MRVRTRAALLLVLLPMAGACGSPGADRVGAVDPASPTASGPAGVVAAWQVDPQRPPTSASVEVAVLVTRLECSGGVTGTVLAPVVRESPTEVSVAYSVDELSEGSYPCPGNLSVPSTVSLASPLGGRRLVDGSCDEAAAREQPGRCGDPQRWPVEGAS